MELTKDQIIGKVLAEHYDKKFTLKGIYFHHVFIQKAKYVVTVRGDGVDDGKIIATYVVTEDRSYKDGFRAELIE